MNTKVEKGIFWGVIVASTVMVINVLHFLLGGRSAFARGPGGHGEMGGRGGFAGHQMMNGPHHGGGFPWLFLIIGLAVLVLLVRWLRKKSKTSSMQQFIDTSLAGSHIPVTNQNAAILDQWEKTILTKKENE
ncbi:hypothetical protein L1999_26800 [Neobacillus drentensis]|uniref:hypothetical protein n=1 Tax=Neobacillus drentensis TaxID=220684 RepID=UPI001F1E8D32|nr:hypothetical protein [Neobacillus drentensis]ULT56603.1 hypothetical protein L1999_26800 [Neobacillus drentensis]